PHRHRPPHPHTTALLQQAPYSLEELGDREAENDREQDREITEGIHRHELYRAPAMTIYVISDLHLDEESEAQLFKDQRQGRELKALCERVARDEGSELVLLGDCFDFTAMQPPPKGLER